MINKTVESGRSRVGQYGRPPPKTSARHLGLHPQSGIRFSSSASSTLTALRENARTTIKSLTNVPENKKVQPKQKTFLHFYYRYSRNIVFFLSSFFVFLQKTSAFAGIARWIIIGKASFPYQQRRVHFPYFVRRREILIPGEKAKLRFRALVTRYRSVAWHPRGTFFAESASLKGFLVKWKRLRRGSEDDQRRIPWPVYRGARTWELIEDRLLEGREKDMTVITTVVTTVACDNLGNTRPAEDN